MVINSSVETIVDGLEPIALIIRAGFDEPGIHFFTPQSFPQQVAVMNHPKGKKLAPHVHNPIPRQVLFTHEVLFVRKGRIKVTLYTSQRAQLCERELTTGDLILLCGGGHAFEMIEETALVEVKQGPYGGDADKIRFEEVAE